MYYFKKGREMKHLDLAVFVKDLDKLFNDMQDKAVDGSALVVTAARVIENQAKETEYWKDAFERAMEIQQK
jgi:hypothetical protein